MEISGEFFSLLKKFKEGPDRRSVLLKLRAGYHKKGLSRYSSFLSLSVLRVNRRRISNTRRIVPVMITKATAIPGIRFTRVSSRTNPHPRANARLSTAAPMPTATSISPGVRPIISPITVAPTPPVPWRGSITKKASPRILQWLIQGCSAINSLLVAVVFSIQGPSRGTRSIRAKFMIIKRAVMTSSRVRVSAISHHGIPSPIPIGIIDSLPDGGIKYATIRPPRIRILFSKRMRKHKLKKMTTRRGGTRRRMYVLRREMSCIPRDSQDKPGVLMFTFGVFDGTLHLSFPPSDTK